MTKGVPPQAGSGHSPKGGAASSTASPAQPSVPNAAPWWRCLHCGCDEYEEHVFTGHMKGVPMVHCANCEILHSPPDPDSKSALRWQISELAEALEMWLAYDDQDEADFAEAGPMLLYARAIEATRTALAMLRGDA